MDRLLSRRGAQGRGHSGGLKDREGVGSSLADTVLIRLLEVAVEKAKGTDGASPRTDSFFPGRDTLKSGVLRPSWRAGPKVAQIGRTRR